MLHFLASRHISRFRIVAISRKSFFNSLISETSTVERPALSKTNFVDPAAVGGNEAIEMVRDKIDRDINFLSTFQISLLHSLLNFGAESQSTSDDGKEVFRSLVETIVLSMYLNKVPVLYDPGV
jgi:hypothetical protein